MNKARKQEQEKINIVREKKNQREYKNIKIPILKKSFQTKKETLNEKNRNSSKN